ncbi:polysaccharide biosynthesis C-terminal domain-containing protein [Streptosporangium vulgare]|uniref:Multidrug-efflux transporter n=1 Tax=Streptosporangium vulgare TaxID=46190 RepID=A0ABV5TKT7_9ACTN
MSSPHRAILSAAVPLFLSMSAGIVAQLVSTALLGHRATAALAAFALAGAVLNPVTAALAAGLRGMTPFVAPHRESPAEALPILRDARWLTVALGAVGAGAVLCVPLIARASGVPGEVTAEFGMLPPLLALNVLLLSAGGGANAVLIALGRSRQVLWSGLSSTAVEVVLLLTLVPWLGVHGTGIALVASTAVAVTVSNACLLRVPGLAGQPLWPGRPRSREILSMARVGIPMSATVLIKFTVLGGLTYVAARTGARGAAAHAILRSLAEFLALTAFAVGQASAPEIARAASPAAARLVNRVALLLAATGAVAGVLLPAFLGTFVVGLFTSDAEVLALVLTLVPLLAVHAVANSCGIAMSAGLTGLRRPAWGLGSAVAGYGLLALIAAPVTAARGLTGLWAAMAVTSVLILVLQGGGFLRHSARVGAPAEPART